MGGDGCWARCILFRSTSRFNSGYRLTLVHGTFITGSLVGASPSLAAGTILLAFPHWQSPPQSLFKASLHTVTMSLWSCPQGRSTETFQEVDDQYSNDCTRPMAHWPPRTYTVYAVAVLN